MRRLLGILVVLALAVVGVRLSMPYMAKRLMRSDPLERADLIVVLGSSQLERTLEAGELYQEGWAPRILLLRSPDQVRDSLRDQLGIHVPVFLDVQESVLDQMHVPPGAVIASPHTQDSTRTEAVATVAYARQQGYRRIIIVTSPYHTARAGALIERAAKGSCRVIMRPDRFEEVDPNRWWLRFPERYDVVREYLSRIYVLFW